MFPIKGYQPSLKKYLFCLTTQNKVEPVATTLESEAKAYLLQ